MKTMNGLVKSRGSKLVLNKIKKKLSF